MREQELMRDQVSHDLWRWRALQGRVWTIPAPYPGFSELSVGAPVALGSGGRRRGPR